MLWYVCVTIVEQEMQQCILCVLLSCMTWSKIQKHWELHNNNTYLGLHVKCLTLPSNFNQIWIFLTDFHIKVPSTQFHGDMSSGSHTDVRRHTDMTTLTALIVTM